MTDLLFVLAMCVGTGAVDYMLDDPRALAIAVMSLGIMAWTGHIEGRNHGCKERDYLQDY